VTNQAASSEWTSLEIVKLLAAFLTPVFLFVLGVMVTRAARRVESAQWASRKLIDTKWEPEWDRLFVAESQASDPVSVVQAYERLMDHFADELGVRGSGKVK
jgi:DNA-binding SARP family transcriptional activator